MYVHAFSVHLSISKIKVFYQKRKLPAFLYRWYHDFYVGGRISEMSPKAWHDHKLERVMAGFVSPPMQTLYPTATCMYWPNRSVFITRIQWNQPLNKGHFVHYCLF